MATFYSTENIEDMREKFSDLGDKFGTHNTRLATFAYPNDKSREYATHGFMRRCHDLQHAMENIFNLLPPDLEVVPQRQA